MDRNGNSESKNEEIQSRRPGNASAMYLDSVATGTRRPGSPDDRPAYYNSNPQQVANAALGEFAREQAVVTSKVNEDKQLNNDKIQIQLEIRQIRPGTADGFDAVRKLRELINGMRSEKVKTQAEKLVVAVETAFSGVNAISDQPGVQKALNAAATAITPGQKRTATAAKRKAEEQQKGQDLREDDAAIRNALNLADSTPLTRSKRADYTKLMAEKKKNEQESRPGTAASLSDIVIDLDAAIDDTETFFEQQPESPASEEELRDFDSLDQISTKSFDYMQVFMNAAAQLPIAAPPPQSPVKSSTFRPQIMERSKRGQPFPLRKKAWAGGRSTAKRRHHKKLRKSTFRRHRKH
jgi:hypothetical protein